jgi:hypothetical protein
MSEMNARCLASRTLYTPDTRFVKSIIPDTRLDRLSDERARGAVFALAAIFLVLLTHQAAVAQLRPLVPLTVSLSVSSLMQFSLRTETGANVVFVPDHCLTLGRIEQASAKALANQD